MRLDGRLYKPHEVATLAGVDLRTLRRWREDRIAPASALSSGRCQCRYTLADIRRVLIVKALRASGEVRYRGLAKAASSVEGADSSMETCSRA